MNDRAHLHDGEVLLASRHASPAVFLVSALRGLLDALIVGAILCGLVFAALYWGFQTLPSVIIYPVVFLVTYGFIIFLRWRVWKHSLFRVTTERILLHVPVGLFHSPLFTIKWPQYQESHVGHRNFFDLFFFSRPLQIRHGTADAHLHNTFPSLTYAEDLKHYLDKVDSAVRKNETAALKPFVARPRGKRD
jgi:hypothetical protein